MHLKRLFTWGGSLEPDRPATAGQDRAGGNGTRYTAPAIAGAVQRADLAAILGYALTAVIFFWKIVGLGMVPLGYDLFTYFYPCKAYAAQLVRSGELPLWNPLIFMGAPLLANIQAAVLYPLDIIFYMLPATEALRLSVVLHVILAAFFTYLFARVSLGLSCLAAWLAGVSFAFGGFLGAHVGHLNQLHAAVWLPALMLCLERAVSKRSTAAVSLGALVFAVQLLAGHTQEVYYSVWALGLFALFMALRGERRGIGRLQPLAACVAIVAMGAGVSAVQLVPTVELARESFRSGGVPYGDAVHYSVHLNDLLDTVLPLYSSVPYVEVAGYTGVVSLLLVPAALADGGRLRVCWFFVGLGLLALLLSLGDETPLYGWLYRVVPGFDLFRAPGRWLFLYSFSVVLLAGIGLDALRMESKEDELRRWLFRYAFWLSAMAGTLVALRLWLGSHDVELGLPAPRVVLTWAIFASLGMAGLLMALARPSSVWPALLLVVLAVLELYLASEPMEYNDPGPGSLYAVPRQAWMQLSEVSPGRLLSLAKERPQPGDDAGLSPGTAKSETEPYRDYRWLGEIVAPNVGLEVGLGTVDGYDGGLLPTRRYAELKQLLLGSAELRPDLTMRAEADGIPSSKLLGALGVHYLLVDRKEQRYDPGWKEVSGTGDAPVRLLENEVALPRAYVVHAAEPCSSDSELLERLRSSDLGRVVLLEKTVDYREPPQPGRDSVTLLQDRANEVILDVSTDQPGFLVLSDSFYPGWKVYVDDREARLLRANHVARAVQLDAGSHRVRFAYEPLSVKIGLAVSLGAILAVVAGGLFARRICLRGATALKSHVEG